MMKIEVVWLSGGRMNMRHTWLFAPNRLRHLPLLAIAAILAFSSPARGQDSDSQEGPRQNRDYYDPRELEDIHIYRNVEKRHLMQGYKEMERKRYLQAYGHVEFMLRYYPNQPKALNLLSELCTKWNSPQCDADGWFQLAIDRNPSIAQTHVLLALHLHRTGRHKEAVESYKTALKLDPNSLNANYNLGLLYFEMGQYALANEHAQRSYSLGAPYPGLREKLQKAGKWQALPDTAASDHATSPAVAEPAPQQKN